MDYPVCWGGDAWIVRHPMSHKFEGNKNILKQKHCISYKAKLPHLISPGGT